MRMSNNPVDNMKMCQKRSWLRDQVDPTKVEISSKSFAVESFHCKTLVDGQYIFPPKSGGKVEKWKEKRPCGRGLEHTKQPFSELEFLKFD